MRALLLFSLYLLLCIHAQAAEPWSQLRGPQGQGHGQAHDLPEQWSETENIRWKTPIPGDGHSSPVIEKELAWMTTSLDGGKSLQVVAVDVASGHIVRQREIFTTTDPPPLNAKNSPASPTPVLEGDRVYVHYGTVGTACLSTVTGETIWANRDLKLDHQEGPGSSPILWKDFLILHCDGRDVQYIVALDKATGQIRWKTNRSGEPAPEANERKAFCTPLVIDLNGQPLLISPAAKRVFAYDPNNGAEQWFVDYSPGFSNVPIPIYGHGLLYICTGYMKPELWAIRPDGAGDITKTNVAWKIKQNAPCNPTPLLIGDELYIVSDGGIATCLDAGSGEVVWRQRLGDTYSASPLFADGKIYFWSEGGKTVVIKPGRTYQEVASNTLDNGFMATPAVLDNALLVRTRTHLYRVEKATATATANK